MSDNRSSMQQLLNRTRWEPFSYITDGNVILRRSGSLYRDVAMITTAIISHMIYSVNRDAERAKRQLPKPEDEGGEQ